MTDSFEWDDEKERERLHVAIMNALRPPKGDR